MIGLKFSFVKKRKQKFPRSTDDNSHFAARKVKITKKMKRFSNGYDIGPNRNKRIE